MSMQGGEADRARDRQLGIVEANADKVWLAEAEALVLQVAGRLGIFTTDDLWAAGLRHPREPRALGAVIRALAIRKVIQGTGGWKASRRAACNARPVKIWKLV